MQGYWCNDQCFIVSYLILVHQVVYFTSTFPYIMMTILVIYNCLLDGATDGLIYYLKPDFNRLADSEVLC